MCHSSVKVWRQVNVRPDRPCVTVQWRCDVIYMQLLTSDGCCYYMFRPLMVIIREIILGLTEQIKYVKFLDCNFTLVAFRRDVFEIGSSFVIDVSCIATYIVQCNWCVSCIATYIVQCSWGVLLSSDILVMRLSRFTTLFKLNFSVIKTIITVIFFLWLNSPLGHFTTLHDHTLRHTTLGRTPLDEWSARRRDLYLTTHNTHNRKTSMLPVGFEPAIPVSERPKTHALDRAATEIG
jgi:hypothetical protein